MRRIYFPLLLFFLLSPRSGWIGNSLALDFWGGSLYQGNCHFVTDEQKAFFLLIPRFLDIFLIHMLFLGVFRHYIAWFCCPSLSLEMSLVHRKEQTNSIWAISNVECFCDCWWREKISVYTSGHVGLLEYWSDYKIIWSARGYFRGNFWQATSWKSQGWMGWEVVGIEFGLIDILVAFEVIGKEELT